MLKNSFAFFLILYFSLSQRLQVLRFRRSLWYLLKINTSGNSTWKYFFRIHQLVIKRKKYSTASFPWSELGWCSVRSCDSSYYLLMLFTLLKFLKKRLFSKYGKIHSKELVPKYLFLKKENAEKVFSCNFAKLLSTPFLYNTFDQLPLLICCFSCSNFKYFWQLFPMPNCRESKDEENAFQEWKEGNMEKRKNMLLRKI